jgi:phage shock protein PspC (stress-responsive transcriptional regulator)
MRSPDISSIERLDTLLAEGKISEEDYETLRSAMERKEEAHSSQDPGSAGGALRRSSRDRVIAGVCGGIAESTGADPLVVRLLAVLLLLISGGTAVFAYLVLALVMPSSEGEPAVRRKTALGGFPWGFAAAVLFMWLVNLVYSVYVLPRFYRFWDEAGAELPGPTQFFVALYNSILGRSLLGLLFQVGFLTLLIVLYTFLPRRSSARVTMWIVLGIAFAIWGVAAVTILYLPLFHVGDIIR